MLKTVFRLMSLVLRHPIRAGIAIGLIGVLFAITTAIGGVNALRVMVEGELFNGIDTNPPVSTVVPTPWVVEDVRAINNWQPPTTRSCNFSPSPKFIAALTGTYGLMEQYNMGNAEVSLQVSATAFTGTMTLNGTSYDSITYLGFKLTWVGLGYDCEVVDPS